MTAWTGPAAWLRWAGLAILMGSPPLCAAELVSVVNTIRAEGCGDQAGVDVALRPSGGLDRVARQLARSGQLSAALERGGYRAARSASIHLEGTDDERALGRVLRDQYCATVINVSLTEIGTYRRGTRTWIVLAQPLGAPDPGDRDAIAHEVLARVNAARREARRCGDREFAATHALELSDVLSRVALEHARDMARRRSMSHRGSDGSEPAQRVTRAGYRWRATAENVAAGQPDATAVVAHWLASPGHCANLMGSQYTRMGVGFATDARNRGRTYWAQVFAAPQSNGSSSDTHR